MNILSPMARGSGAHVLHAELARRIDGYRLRNFSPWWTLFPPSLRRFARGRAELIHTGADYGMFLRRRGVPQVLTLHNYVCDRFMRPYSSPLQYLHYRSDLRYFLKRSLLGADAVVAISRFMMERVRVDLGLSIPMRLIYNGIDEQRFVPAENGCGRPGPFRVLFCGNLNRRKRPELLVPLANALGEGFQVCYTTGLAGGDAIEENLRPGAATLHCLGKVEYSDMPALYRSMDLLFMPSVREGFGLCVAEAMACGLPVVACGESALPELVVDGQGGVLRGIDDLAGYAAAIRSIADSPERRRSMGQFNRDRVESLFTLDRMVAEYLALFEEVLLSPLAGG